MARKTKDSYAQKLEERIGNSNNDNQRQSTSNVFPRGGSSESRRGDRGGSRGGRGRDNCDRGGFRGGTGGDYSGRGGDYCDRGGSRGNRGGYYSGRGGDYCDRGGSRGGKSSDSSNWRNPQKDNDFEYRGRERGTGQRRGSSNNSDNSTLNENSSRGRGRPNQRGRGIYERTNQSLAVSRGRGAGRGRWQREDYNGQEHRLAEGTKSFSRRRMTQEELIELEGKVENNLIFPADLLMEIADENRGFQGLILTTIITPEMYAQIMYIISMALRDKSSPYSQNMLLKNVLHSELFKKSLEKYIENMKQLVELDKMDQVSYCLKNILQVVELCFERIESEALDKLQVPLLTLFSKIRILKRHHHFEEEILKQTEDLEVKLDNTRSKLITSSKPTSSKSEIDQQKRQHRINENPPNDYKEIPIIPTTSELSTSFTEIYLKENKIKGSYDTNLQYIDTIFRLTREDMVEPLRRGLNELKKHGDDRKRYTDIRVYQDVRLLNLYWCSNNGISMGIQLNKDTSIFKKVKWNFSKRLIHGSLICVSNDKFETVFYATVENRDKMFLETGIFQVIWINEPNEELKDNHSFTMVETTAYYESYKHVLKALQEMETERIPYSRYLVECRTNNFPPQYLQRDATIKFDFSCVIKPSKQNKMFEKVDIMDDSTWPSAETLDLDESQYHSMKSVLTQELSLTQGPPGTGKTYVGLKIAKLLTENVVNKFDNFGPMLLVCYTNHALDQFLEDIVKAVNEGVVRVGGRCKSEYLQPFLLHEHRKNQGRDANYGSLVRKQVKQMELDIDIVNTELYVARNSFVNSRFLKEHILPTHLKNLEQHDNSSQFHRFQDSRKKLDQAIMFWLLDINIDYISANMLPFEMIEAIDDVSEEMIDEVMNEIFLNEESVQNVLQEYWRTADFVNNEITYTDDENNIESEAYAENNRRLLDEDSATNSHTDRSQVVNRINKMISFDFEVIDESLTTNDGFQVVINWHQKQRQLQYHMQQNNLTIFSPEDEEEIDNLWTLTLNERWQLYNTWKNKYCYSLAEENRQMKEKYNDLRMQCNEARMQCDRKVFSSSKIIAMTTTGAARYQKILDLVKPKIVIVEEAAEVLESHILSSISTGCQQLILIGDHKQLRPKPCVYDLAKKFHLDVSMFERLINNKLPCATLKYQHRMRPEISQYMKHIYSDLRDHEVVKEHENVKGVNKNVMFFHHENEEKDTEETSSKCNPFEASLVAEFACYLVKQGYSQDQITILTLYNGQLFQLKSLIKSKPLLAKIRATVVDNFQGEENDVILLSLVRSNKNDSIGFLEVENRVCVALSRAKKGLFLFGNINLLVNKSRLWDRVVDTARSSRCVDECLTLKCQNHPQDAGIIIRTPTDFQKAADGGCSKMCGFRLKCGHSCKKLCHPIDMEHKEIQCKEYCTKKCERGHPCKLKCFQMCKCEEPVNQTIPRCGHEQEVPCHVPPELAECNKECPFILDCGHNCSAPCGKPHQLECKKKSKTKLPCGHTILMPCKENMLTFKCTEKCESPLDCGHTCRGTCGECTEGRLHMTCQEKCSRDLICGHRCTDQCQSNCSPCIRECINTCKHSKCNQSCGDKCIPCKEPCIVRCKHQQCTKLCDEECDVDPCTEPCGAVDNKGLCFNCKAPRVCIALCSECSVFRRHFYICEYCHTNYKEIFFGNEDDPSACFIKLQTCGHFFEVTGMDEWMNTKAENNEIVRKTCPKCRTPITKESCVRYCQIVKKIEHDIQQVKQKTRGLNDNNDGNVDIEETFGIVISKFSGMITQSSFVHWMAQCDVDATSISILRVLTCALNNVVTLENLALKQRLHLLNRLRVLDAFQEQILDNLLQNSPWFRAINNEKPTISLRDNYFDLKKEESLKYYNFRLSLEAHVFLRWLKYDERKMEFSDFSVKQAEIEINRLSRFIQLLDIKYDIGTVEASEAVEKVNKKLGVALRLISDGSRYSTKRQLMLDKNFENIKKLSEGILKLKEQERKMIVAAMGLAQGHWYKCPNGHIYAIGDCGGANQTATCPECKETIGGQNHELARGNQHTGEMDGSSYAAWSDQANQAIMAAAGVQDDII